MNANQTNPQEPVTKPLFSTKRLTLIGLMTALLCILAPLSIPLPLSPVPLSLTNFVLFLSLYILGTTNSFICYLVYLLLGLAGVPVFSNFSGGAAKLLGPTGGYLFGFLFLIPITGIIMQKWKNSRLIAFGGMVLGHLVCCFFGTAWLAYQTHASFGASLFSGVVLFIPGDLIKMFLALLIGPELRKRLAHFLK